MIRKIHESTSVTEFRAPIEQPFSFKGIFIRITGTNAACLALTLNDFGTLEYDKGNAPVIRAEFEGLSHLTNMFGGFARVTSTAGAAIEFTFYIPRRFQDNNVDIIVPSDNAEIRCSFKAAFDTDVSGDATIEVDLDLERGVQKYDLKIRQVNKTIGGQITQDEIPINEPNILMLMVGDIVSSVLTTASSNITHLATEVEEFNSGQIAIGTLTAYTSSQFQVESNFVNVVVPYMAEGDITSRLADSASVKVTTTGAATPQIYVVSAQFDNDRLERSAAIQNERFNTILARKRRRNQLQDTMAIPKIVNAGKPVAQTVARS